MSLYQAVRPEKFADIVGNRAAVSILANAVAAEDDRPHAFLFHGPSGCGKTTLARILARELGCDVRPEGSANFQEFNAAEARGIDVVRSIIADSQYEPLIGGNRLVLIDEAHRLTGDAASALLKPLEDTPPYQYYALCTTEPHKILKTIHTRCVSVEVKPLSEDDLVEVLDGAAKRAGMDELPDAVLDAIVRKSDSCPRSALTMMEQTRGLTEDAALKAVQAYRSSEAQAIDVCRALVQGKGWSSLLAAYNGVEDKEPEAMRRCLLGYLRSCMMKTKAGAEAGRFAHMIEELADNTFDCGEAGLLAMVYRAWNTQ